MPARLASRDGTPRFSSSGIAAVAPAGRPGAGSRDSAEFEGEGQLRAHQYEGLGAARRGERFRKEHHWRDADAAANEEPAWPRRIGREAAADRPEAVPAMADGRDSPRTWAAVQQLMDVYTGATISSTKDQVFMAESLKHLNELSNYRRARLFTSRGTVPQLLWYLLFGGGAVLIAFTYFFGHESIAWQGAMTAALAGTLSFSLYLIVAYNGPFDGTTRVSPAPYQLELEHVTARP